MANKDDWKRQGKYLFAAGKYDEAIKSLNRSIQKNPSDAESWIYKGRSLYYQAKYMDAIKCYERASAEEPDNEDAWMGKVQCCDKLIDLSAKNAYAWDEKVGALIHLNKYEDALKICESSLGFQLTNAILVWNHMARINRENRSYNDAIMYYTKTIKQDPKNEEAWMDCGKSLYLLGKKEEAIKCFDRAIDINPANEKTWALKGVALKSLYRYDEAKEALSRAGELGYKF